MSSAFSTARVTHGCIRMHIRSWLLKDLKVMFNIRPVLEHPDHQVRHELANRRSHSLEYDIDDADGALSSSWPSRQPDLMSRISFWFHPDEFRVWSTLVFNHCNEAMGRAQRIFPFHGIHGGIGFGIDFYLTNEIDFDFFSEEAAAVTAAAVAESSTCLMQFKYYEDEDDESESKEEECAICLGADERNKGQDLTCLPCSHVFHYQCVTNWFLTKPTCPLCRYVMPFLKGG